jgi:hypothetical protein
MKINISAIILWGAVWGLVEATLGYVLHSFSLSVGWLFWFPLAFCFMDKVYRQTNSLISILYTSVIAAAVKLIDFLLPTSIDRIINPAVSIILEGLVVFAAFKIIERKQYFFRFKYLEALAASVGWRVLYIVYILLMPAFFFNASPLRAVNPFLKFFLLESIMNSLIIYAYIKIAERTNTRKEKAEQTKENKFKHIIAFVDTNIVFRTSLSFSMLALAFYVQWAL